MFGTPRRVPAGCARHSSRWHRVARFGSEDREPARTVGTGEDPPNFGNESKSVCFAPWYHAASEDAHNARLSLSIGFVGVILSLVLGILLGGISGYFGGAVDMVIQRIIELLQTIPRIPLWLTLSAALPRDWGTVETYFGITIILSVLGWTGLARTVRGKFLALREEDFTQAAKYLGASEMRIIIRHMAPSFSTHLIAVLTLRVPEMILAETSLSFLGLGLRKPVISWSVLLTGVQNIRAVALAPWLFLPGLAIVVTVLAFNFVGDGLRDAADPYAQ